MKKLLGSILSVSLVASFSSLVVACRHESLNLGLEGQRLIVITDAGTIGDHGFNEQIYNAMRTYSIKEFGLSAKDNWIQPLKSDYESYVNSYKLAKYKGTDIFVLIGFQHEMSRMAASEIAGKDKTVIIVDSGALDGEKNVMPLSFSSELSGFAAAYDTAVWATTIDPVTNKMQGQVYDKDYVSFGTYGGISNKSAVGTYMWGFLVGMGYFNARIEQEARPTRQLKLANFGVNGELSQLSGVQPTDNRFFSGSFEVGGANRAGINDLLGPNDGKADVIFPVAGGQILDTLSTNQTANIVGVDVNQALQFPEYGGRFVTSAIKDFKMALSDTFDHSKGNRLNHKINEDDTLGDLKDTGPANGEFWDGTIPVPSSSWSHDLDQTTESKGVKIPKSLIDFAGKDRELADKLVQFFDNTGSDSKDFLIWSGEKGIEAMINQLLELPPLPIDFPPED